MQDYTWASVLWMYSLMATFVIGAVFFLIKGIRSGVISFDEAPKYQMLEDDDTGSVAIRDDEVAQTEGRDR